MPSKYKQIKLRNMLWSIVTIIIIMAVFVRSILSLITVISALVGLHILFRWIEERELELEWLKLKVDYLRNPHTFDTSGQYPMRIIDSSYYLGDCYENDEELILDIKNDLHSTLPNDRRGKFLHQDWLTGWTSGRSSKDT